ncbi:unnamed protein product [Caenorhabditis sp. 36 PRJEB53466]|nr:unnamed protein product [Caenorhabditis sp. 36 PRJEB53466]
MRIEKRTSPTAVSDLIGSHVTRIAAGACHTLAVCKGFVYPFGLNSSGQLGNGKVSTQSTPRKTEELDHVTSVFAGYHQTFFIRSAGSIEQKELVGPNCPLKYPAKIDRESLENLLKNGEKLDVMALLESVFSSLSNINNSFLYTDSRKFDVGFERGHGVDLDQVMETFLLFDESPNKQQYLDLIVDSFAIALAAWNPRMRGVECLRIFLIVPWLPVFTENVTLETLERVHNPLVNAFLSLDETFKNAMNKWWQTLSTRHFRRQVLVFKSAVRTMLCAGKTAFDCLKYLKILEQLFLINKTYHHVPLETFYIDEINDLVALQYDYVSLNWEKEKPNWTKEAHWTNWPFLLNGVAKGYLLQTEGTVTQHIESRRQLTPWELLTQLNEGIQPKALQLNVRRDFIVADTMNQMSSLSNEVLQLPLRVKIAGEEADDAGGVRKEFFLIVMRKILQPDYGMFIEDEESRLVWFSGISAEICERDQFHQLGRLVGMAIYNNVLVPFPFPKCLYKHLLDMPPTLEDLIELSPTEGNSLQKLLEYEGDDVADVFCLTHTINFTVFDDSTTVELVPGGADLAVDNQNRDEFVRLYVRHRLELGPNDEIRAQSTEFRRGFHDALHSRILRFFQPRELQELVVGNENYDWSQFREIVKYKGEYSSSHPTIQTFWKVFFALDEEERRQFLLFLCGSTRIPVAGMSHMHVAIQPSSKESLPVAHTCFNLLDLPNISDEEEMLRRLRISIQHIEGFTLV